MVDHKNDAPPRLKSRGLNGRSFLEMLGNHHAINGVVFFGSRHHHFFSMSNDRRASIPVTVLTVLTLVLFVFALASFALTTRALVLETTMSAAFVTTSAMEHRAQAFVGNSREAGEFVREDIVSQGMLWWKTQEMRLRVRIVK